MQNLTPSTLITRKRLTKWIINSSWKSYIFMRSIQKLSVGSNLSSLTVSKLWLLMVNSLSSLLSSVVFPKELSWDQLWNAIPYHLNVVNKAEHFKDQLIKFMLSIPDTPPIRGYASKNSNSLLCWRKEWGHESPRGGRRIWWPRQVLTKLNIGNIGIGR